MSVRGLKVLGVLSLTAVSGLHCAAPEEEDHDDHAHGDEYANEWNDAYSQEIKDPKCSGILVPDGGPFGGRVALTFDDGPKLSTTGPILDTLAAHNIKATFLINGKRVTSEAHRALLRRMVEEGHIVGNHTQNHKNAVEIEAGEFRQQVQATDDIIRDVGITPSYFRFPYGSSNCATAQTVRDAGYIVTGWHVDTADWCFASSKGGVGHCHKETFKWVPDSYRDDMVGYSIDQLESANGGIVLFHDVHENTANNLESFIQRAKDAGYSFVNIDDEGSFPVLNGGAPDTTWIGTACQNDEDCTFNPDAYCLQGLSSGVCSIPCEGYCPDQAGFGTSFCATLGEGGACAIKADAANEMCADLPGTAATDVARFVGSSSAPATSSTVCLP